jgi:hypothetical protein
MIWLVLAVLSVIAVALMLVTRRTSTVDLSEVDDEEIVRAAVELHAISQRLSVAWARHELRGETNRLRRELAEEMRRVDALESASPLDERSGD